MKNQKPIVFACSFLACALAFGLEIPLTKGGGGKGIAVGYVDMDLIFQEFPETKKAKEDYYAELAAKREELAEHDKEMSDLREQMSILKTTLSDLDRPPEPEPPAALPVPPPAPAAPDVLSISSAVPPVWTEPPSVSSATLAPAPLLPGSTAAALSQAPAAAAPAAPKARSSLLEKLGLTEGVSVGMRATLEQRQKMLQEGERALDEERKKAVADLKALEERRAMQIFGKLYRALTQLAEEQGVSLVVDKASLLYGEAGLDLTESLRRRVRGIPEPSQH